MSPLYLWNGKLLVVGGSLAAGPDCCCGESDSDSPSEPYEPYGPYEPEPYNPPAEF